MPFIILKLKFFLLSFCLPCHREPYGCIHNIYIYIYLISNELHWKKRKNRGNKLEYGGSIRMPKIMTKEDIISLSHWEFQKISCSVPQAEDPFPFPCALLWDSNYPNAYCSKIKLYPSNHDRACLSKEIPYLSHNCSCIILLFHLPQTARTKLELNGIKKQRRTLENWSFWP